ncbi:hypothetical protein ACH4K5_10655 [Streptomyces albidoflavus]
MPTPAPRGASTAFRGRATAASGVSSPFREARLTPVSSGSSRTPNQV